MDQRLQVPKEWTNTKRSRNTSTKVTTAASSASQNSKEQSKKRFKSDTTTCNNSADSLNDICRSICENIGRCEDLEYELDFSDVLSHIDYRGVLEGLFGGKGIGADVPVRPEEFELLFHRCGLTRRHIPADSDKRVRRILHARAHGRRTKMHNGNKLRSNAY